MPSSSTHGSKGEDQLILLYQLIFLRFWYTSYKNLAHDTTAYFEDLLDWGNDENLVRTLCDDPKWVKDWEKYIRGKKTSENIWSAADYLCDAAQILRNYGRVTEADKFLRWVEGVQALAREAEYDEKNEKDWSSSDYYHHGG